jgi:Terminase large subunit, T4likevirus-type, N-terminal
MLNYSVAEYRVNADGLLVPYCFVDGELKEVAWAPLPGSQTAFLQCSELEVLFEGTRGGCGKTLALIMDFLQLVGIGLGAEHRGIIFRRTFPQLADMIALSRIWIPKIFPDAIYNEMQHVWRFPDGATLQFSHFYAPEQFEDFQGKSFTFVGFEELANWPNVKCLKLMLSCLRSTHPRAMLHLRSTTNTYGIGRDAIMERYRLPLAPGMTLGPVIADSHDEDGNLEPPRRVVHGYLEENLLLLYSDPQYKSRTLGSTDDPAKKRAWAFAEWAAPPSAMFADMPWECVGVPSFTVPTPGRIRMAYDHGSARPFAVLFVWESDGSDIEFPDGRVRSTVRGDLFVVDEIYGGRKNEGLKLPIGEIAARINRKIEGRGWDPRICRRSGNVADTSIFDENDGRPSLAHDFEDAGVIWERADKGPGSRIQGVEQLRKMLSATKPVDGLRERPGLFVCENCVEFLRTVPTLQRSDSNPEDVDTESDDHLFDAIRYYLRKERSRTISTRRRQIM